MKLSPHVRIVSAILISITILLIPVTSILLIPIPALVWLIICRPEQRIIIKSLKIGAFFFLPFVILLPWIKIPLFVSIRGLSLLIIGMSTMHSVAKSEIIPALSSLPLPSVVRMIIIQVLYQTGTLQNETARMAKALKVRNVTAGIAMRRSLIFKWPAAWLLRVLVRAERVSNAMEMRDYTNFPFKNFILKTTAIDVAFILFLLTADVLIIGGRIYGKL